MNPLLLDIPDTIETPRLKLCVPKAGDGATVATSVIESLNELKPWVVWASETYDQQAGEEWSRRCAAEFITREQLGYCIYRDGEHVGNLNAFRFEWNVPGCELGYWMRTRFSGNGYMTEAVNGLVDMLKGLGMVRINIRCDENNHRSAAVAERCGFAMDGILRYACRINGTLRNDRVYSKLVEGNRT